MFRRFLPKSWFPPLPVILDWNKIVLDGGRSHILFHQLRSRPAPDFHDPSHTSRVLDPQYLVTNILPPAPPTSPLDGNSSLCPPFHIHLKEDEIFHVVQGTARFMLLDSSSSKSHDADGQKQIIASQNETVTIPRGQIHTFRNASSSQQLRIEFGFRDVAVSASLHQQEKLDQKMTTFLLSAQLYRDTCQRMKKGRLLPQVLLFNYMGDVAPIPAWLLSLHRQVPWLRVWIERHAAAFVGRCMNLVGGLVVGRWLLGLPRSWVGNILRAKVYSPPEKRVPEDGPS